MTLAVSIFVAALSLPGPWYPPGRCPEADAQRAERLAVIALALAAETHDADDWAEDWLRADWAWAAFVKTWHESRRFAVEVHDGRKRGELGEVCLGQIMGGGDDLAGTDIESTRRCYREVLRLLQLHRQRCLVRVPSIAGVTQIFSGYGSGYSCSSSWLWAQQRAAMWGRLQRS
jgi:hypothetical protein